MDAASLATWAAGTALTAGSLFFAWRIDRRQRVAESPLVEVDVMPSRKLPGWIACTIRARNPTPVRWTLAEVDFFPHKHVQSLPDFMAEPPDPIRREPNLETAQANAKRQPMSFNYPLLPAGTPTSRVSTGDTTHCGFFLLPSRPGRSVSIRVTLRSSEAKARSVTIASKRIMPPPISEKT